MSRLKRLFKRDAEVKREQFLNFLTQAIKDGQLTEPQAKELLSRFDAKEIDENDLPLTLEDAIKPTTLDDARRALEIIGLSLILSSFSQRSKARDVLQDRFEQKVKEQAVGIIKVSNWQSSFIESIQNHILGQSMLGRGRVLEQADLNYLDDVIRRQFAYASRFADEIAIRKLLGTPMSDADIARRSALYSGSGRAVWFQSYEDEEAGDGYVVDFVARDDKSTCGPCMQAELDGPYLPGQGPHPGEVCEGFGNCRCRRELRYAPAEWGQLTGQVLRAA